MRNFQHHVIGTLFDLVLPVSEDSPSVRRKLLIDQRIPFRITANLVLPVFAIDRGNLVMFRASMPEAAVNEHSQAISGKYDGRFPG